MIFDIANFSGQPTITGVPRYVIELLKRLVGRDDLEITTICSLPEEEFALRNFRRFFPVELPFRSKNVENYTLPARDVVIEPSRLKRLEDSLRERFPNSRILAGFFDTVRAIKWKVKPPPFLSERGRSELLEKLVRESDLYFSPFHPLIPELDANPDIRKVLVVHDLIPILFADLYREHRFFQKNPWESITPDMLVITVSESTRRDLLDVYPHIVPEQVVPILLGVDERFKPCPDRGAIDRVLEKYGIPGRSSYILSLATLDIRKNFDHVMRCFSDLVQKHGARFPDLRLVLTGTRGWRDKKFKEAFGDLPESVRPRIVFTGYVDDEDLPLLYAGATCFCYMSIYEGFGLPPLEAMRSGTPVIVSDNSSLPEVVGEAGILLDAHDKEGLTDAFYRILTDENLRREKIGQGLARSALFTWDRYVERFLELIGPDDRRA